MYYIILPIKRLNIPSTSNRSHQGSHLQKKYVPLTKKKRSIARKYSQNTYQTQDKSIDGDDVILPDDVVYGVYAFVDVRASRLRIGHLVHQIVAEFPQVS